MCAIQRYRDHITCASTVVVLFLRLIFKIVSPRRFIDCAVQQFAVNRAARQKLSAEAEVKHERPSKLCALTAVLAPFTSRFAYFFFFLNVLHGYVLVLVRSRPVRGEPGVPLSGKH